MRRTKTKKKYLAAAILLFCAAAFVKVFVSQPPVNPELAGAYEVVRVVDGDTFVALIAGEKVKVRLIGVDTPESVHPDKSKNTEAGKTASDYTKEMLDGKSVYLEYDVDTYDRYDRMLAYVYLSDGTTMLNRLLLESGNASVMTVQPNVKYADEFYELQKEAQRKHIGIWEGEIDYE